MSKRKTPVWFKIVMLVFLLGAAVKIISLHAQIADKKAELESLTLRVQEYEAANAALKVELQKGMSVEDLSELARSELSYAEPGERVFVDTSAR